MNYREETYRSYTYSYYEYDFHNSRGLSHQQGRGKQGTKGGKGQRHARKMLTLFAGVLRSRPKLEVQNWPAAGPPAHGCAYKFAWEDCEESSAPGIRHREESLLSEECSTSP